MLPIIRGNARSETEEKIMYGHWKANTSYDYDLVISGTLEWPSLTVEWVPELDRPAGADYSVQKLVLGTYTAGGAPNYLIIAEVRLPDLKEGRGYIDFDGFGSPDCKVQIIQRIKHAGEVMRARCMPQNPSIIATKTISSEVHVFDSSKHPLTPPLFGACRPDLRLRGHDNKGYGLSWNEFKNGYLLSCSDDHTICLWDINATPRNMALDAMRKFMVHSKVVEDVAWHSESENLLGAVDKDGYLHIWDIRCPYVCRPVQKVWANGIPVTCLSFNPSVEWLLATGLSDSTVKLFDQRKISTPIHTMNCHNGEVLRVEWSPHYDLVLAAACSGSTVMVWDVIGLEEEKQKKRPYRPPKRLNVHRGHRSKVSDLSWNPCDEWGAASVSGDGLLQVWKLSGVVHDEEDDDDDQNDDMVKLKL